MKAKIETCVVSDRVAEKVLRMAECFFSNPENVKNYEAWHLKEYGCLPNENQKADEVKRTPSLHKN